jgi:hypothetical protein
MGTTSIILSIAILLIICILYYTSWSGAAPDASPRESFNDWSPYGNITDRDIDMLASQRVIGELPSSDNQPLDNSALVAQLVNDNGSVFQPLGQGVTPTSYGGMASFQMGEPDYKQVYMSPHTGVLNADEALARKQQHRGSLNQRAVDGKARSTADLYKRYFNNELNETDTQDWWTAEAADLETDWD